MNDRTALNLEGGELVRHILATVYRQLCADETAVSYLYGALAMHERRAERRELFWQMSVRASEAAERYAQRGGDETRIPSVGTRLWFWCVIAFGYGAAFHWIDRIERRELKLKSTLLHLLLRVREASEVRATNVVAFTRSH